MYQSYKFQPWPYDGRDENKSYMYEVRIFIWYKTINPSNDSKVHREVLIYKYLEIME